MKKINHIVLVLVFLAALSSGCNNQRFASTETDDIYYSSTDRARENGGDYNTVNEVSGEDYKSPSENAKDDYYSIGREVSDKGNPKAEGAYAESQVYSEHGSIANDDATTVNNFYGNTTYAEGNSYDDSYASRIRRFDQRNAGFGYYDPFYVDPYWNYGWSAWNPYPRAGWSVGYNTQYGWNTGFNYGWGYSGWGNNNYCSWNSWNAPYYNNNPYMNGCYGGLGYYTYGYGYDPYRNGYWNGYRDGYYGGSTLGNNNWNNNLRQVVNSRTGMVGNQGFSGNVANDVRDSRLQNRQTLESTGMASNRNVVLQNDVKTNRRDISNEMVASDNSGTPIKNDQHIANSNAEVAASKYSKMTRDVAQSKYDLVGAKSSKSQTTVAKDSKMTRVRASSAYSGARQASYQKNDKMNASSNNINRTGSSYERSKTDQQPVETTTRTRGASTSTPSSSVRSTATPSTYKSPREVNRTGRQPTATPSRQSKPRTNSSTPSQGRTRVSQPQRTRSSSPQTNAAHSRRKSSYSTTRSNSNVNRSSGNSRQTAPRTSAPSHSSSPTSSPSRGSSSSKSIGGRR